MTKAALFAVFLPLTGCTDDPLLHLDKNHWVCTETQTYMETRIVIAGKVVVPHSYESVRCVNYKFAGPR